MFPFIPGPLSVQGSPPVRASSIKNSVALLWGSASVPALASSRISRQESPAVWADAAIRAAENARRRDTSAEMRAGGFDIVTEAKKLEEFYFALLK